MGMYFECELNKIDIDEVLSTVRYIEPEDLVVLYREKIRRLESALKKSEDGAEKLMTENERLKEELKLVQGDNCELREAVTTANMRNGVLTKRNRELKQQLDELEAIHEKDINKLRADLAESHINSMELAGDLVFAEVRLEKANKKLLNSQFGLQSIAKAMGFKNDSSVRSLLNDQSASKMNKSKKTADTLKQCLKEKLKDDPKAVLDVGVGVERELGVSKEKLNEALYIMQQEGYQVWKGSVPQATNPGKKTNLRIVGPEGTPKSAPFDYEHIHSVSEYTSRDNGETFSKTKFPVSMDPKRLAIRYH